MTGRPVGEDICKGVVDPSPTGALARLCPIDPIDDSGADPLLAVRIAHSHNSLVDVINALADLVTVLDQRLDGLEEFLGLRDDDEPWVDVVVKGDLL